MTNILVLYQKANMKIKTAVYKSFFDDYAKIVNTAHKIAVRHKTGVQDLY
jgi:hypothetical protein